MSRKSTVGLRQFVRRRPSSFESQIGWLDKRSIINANLLSQELTWSRWNYWITISLTNDTKDTHTHVIDMAKEPHSAARYDRVSVIGRPADDIYMPTQFCSGLLWESDQKSLISRSYLRSWDVRPNNDLCGCCTDKPLRVKFSLKTNPSKAASKSWEHSNKKGQKWLVKVSFLVK